MNTTNTSLPSKRTPVEFLRNAFVVRRERNPLYTMSAFARDLGVSSSLLSRIFAGSRPLTLKFAMQAAAGLQLGEDESNALVLGTLQSSSRSAKISKKVRAKLEAELSKTIDERPQYSTVEIERFKAMSQWYHLALLNLTAVEGFSNDPIWIGRQLGISTAEAQEAIQRLIAVGLLTENDEKLQRTQKNFYVKSRQSEFAIRKFHEQMITKAGAALQRIDDVSFQSRLINGITFACGPEHLELIKEKIDRFEDEVLAITNSGTRSSVYQLNVQFFPLTKVTQEK